jgi:hypothetical protein
VAVTTFTAFLLAARRAYPNSGYPGFVDKVLREEGCRTVLILPNKRTPGTALGQTTRRFPLPWTLETRPAPASLSAP